MKITDEMIDAGVRAFVNSGSICRSGGGQKLMVEEILRAAHGLPIEKNPEIKNPPHWIVLDAPCVTQSYSEYLQELREVPLFP